MTGGGTHAAVAVFRLPRVLREAKMDGRGSFLRHGEIAVRDCKRDNFRLKQLKRTCDVCRNEFVAVASGSKENVTSTRLFPPAHKSAKNFNVMLQTGRMQLFLKGFGGKFRRQDFVW